MFEDFKYIDFNGLSVKIQINFPAVNKKQISRPINSQFIDIYQYLLMITLIYLQTCALKKKPYTDTIFIELSIFGLLYVPVYTWNKNLFGSCVKI